MGEQTPSPKDDKIQAAGRKQNAAQPLDATKDNAGPERYPSVSKDDSIERTGRTQQVTGEGRSFGGPSGNPQPRQGAGDTSAEPSVGEGRLGPAGDPVEGKR